MRFAVETNDMEVPILINHLFELTGLEPWKRRFEWLNREWTENQFMRPWLRQHCAIELAMKDAFERRELALNRPFLVRTLEQYQLVSFVVSAVRCHEQLRTPAKRRLQGSLLHGLKEDTGLLSLQHELSTAVHLMTQGFDVDFHDMEAGGGHDFTAHKGAIEIEVECKMFSADLGRKFHKRSTAALCNLLQGVLEEASRGMTGGLIASVTLPKRLGASLIQHREVERAVRTALLGGTPRTVSEHCSIQLADFELQNSPFTRPPDEVSNESVGQFVERVTGSVNRPVILSFQPGKQALVLALNSEEPDTVLEGMRRQLREAAKRQFTKTKPAYIAAQVQDLSAEQMTEMAELDSPWAGNATGLQKMTSDFLQSQSGSHIHTVVYRSHGTLVSDGRGSLGGPGPAYVMKNRLHPLANDHQYSIFGPDLVRRRIIHE